MPSYRYATLNIARALSTMGVGILAGSLLSINQALLPTIQSRAVTHGSKEKLTFLSDYIRQSSPFLISTAAITAGTFFLSAWLAPPLIPLLGGNEFVRFVGDKRRGILAAAGALMLANIPYAVLIQKKLVHNLIHQDDYIEAEKDIKNWTKGNIGNIFLTSTAFVVGITEMLVLGS